MYKRQEVGLFQRGGGHPVDHMGKPRRPRLAVLVHLAVAAVRRDLDVQSPVSYTHLDVYKRQTYMGA